MRSLLLLNPSKLAVVLIDLQKGYCDPQSDCAVKLGEDVSKSDAVCKKTEKFLLKLRKVLPSDRILWVQMEEADTSLAVNLRYGPGSDDTKEEHKFIPLCVRGTPGHDFHIVKPIPGEPIFQKFHFSVFHSLEFRDYLQANGITQLAFLGVIGSRCVNASILAASSLGYECILLKDLVACAKNQRREMKEHLAITTFFYALELSSKEFLQALREKKAAA